MATVLVDLITVLAEHGASGGGGFQSVRGFSAIRGRPDGAFDDFPSASVGVLVVEASSAGTGGDGGIVGTLDVWHSKRRAASDFGARISILTFSADHIALFGVEDAAASSAIVIYATGN